MTKQDLNGHYCLATKEHYDKLVEDGHQASGMLCIAEIRDELLQNSSGVLFVMNGMYQEVRQLAEQSDYTPMHLHNNEWVKHFLTHKDAKEADNYCKKWDEMSPLEPKPVERITREEAKDKNDGGLLS